jgi:hypothetical protein
MSYLNTSSHSQQSVIPIADQIITSTLGYPYTNSFADKMRPTFSMEFYKSENGGFVLNLLSNDKNNQPTNKLFILKEEENIGRDVQNILVMEVLKS